MKLLITGGAGFIGSNFAQYIIERYPDYEVVNLDALTHAGSLDNLSQIIDSPRHRFVQGRIEEVVLVNKLVEGVDVVVNFAAESHVDRSISRPQPFIQTNIVGTQTLLEAARQHQVKLFCQISTDEVYGDLELESPERFSESSPLKPSSPYAASKAAADLLARAYYRTFGLPVIVLRCCNNYGPRQHREKFIPTVVLNALQDKPIPVYGNGRFVRDWIYVLDHCRAIDLILHQGKAGEIYNISANNEWLNIDLAKKILQIMDKPDSLLSYVADRPGHDRRYSVDSGKLRREWGWHQMMDFEQGLRETIQWYQHRANQWAKSPASNQPLRRS